ncbi:MAG: metallopeptidase TldD-related protein [Planctomycetota bacterium]
MKIMAEELQYSMEHLVTEDGTKPYFIAYTITDSATVSLRAELGALESDDSSHRRILDVEVRVGDYALDNTHKLRGRTRGGGGGMRGAPGAARISLEDKPEAIRHALWQATDQAFASAVETYQQVLTNLKTMVEEAQQADDFSREQPSAAAEAAVELSIDRDEWARRLRAVSRLVLDYPLIERSGVTLSGSAENRTLVTSEGTRLQTGRELWRVMVSAGLKAEDGMDLSQSLIFDAASEERLPSADAIRKGLDGVIKQVLALRDAPLVDPYTGPAILLNRASGVFFHEIFGHRIEGHRQKDVEEGQTFAKMVGEPVLPDFMTVSDDPTRAQFNGTDLRGFYHFDDEGTPSSRVDLVKDGILKTFLMCRSPIPGVPASNGHGRRQAGQSPVARQANLIVESTKSVPFARLREMLVEECKKQGKPYGYLFDDITGGFTTTTRSGPQAFKVLPVVVYRVHADGQPDQLVRGVDIVGTPLACFSKILCTGDDPAIFNGTCGAESGSVPVSAVSPSILVQEIEIEKQARSQERPPILPPPTDGPPPTH